MREASGLAPMPFPGLMTHRQMELALGTTRDDCTRFDKAQGYDIDLVVGASFEFRRTVLPPHWNRVSRGEAQHILRALLAAGWTPPSAPIRLCPDCGRFHRASDTCLTSTPGSTTSAGTPSSGRG